MSVICQCDFGWLICHRAYINSLYTVSFADALTTDDNGRKVRLKLKPELFEIKTPFRRQPEKAPHGPAVIDLPQNSHYKRKHTKQRKFLDGITEDTGTKEVQDTLRQALKELVSLGLEVGYLREGMPTKQEQEENNGTARRAYKKFMFTTQDPSPHSCSTHITTQKSSCVVSHGDVHSRITLIGEETYVIPSESSCILGNLSCLEKYVKQGEKFDFILMDPPWHNKSAKRHKSYEWLRDEDLLALPIKELAKPGCLIAVWTTNNVIHNDFVKKTMFPKWSINYLTDWHWLKVTWYGHPVCALDDPHKKPFENLILGCTEGDEHEEQPTKAIENHKVFISIPSIIHSHKPPLSEILKPYLHPNAKCLELFARYLLPNYTSFGNQVLMFQNIKLFDQEVSYNS